MKGNRGKKRRVGKTGRESENVSGLKTKSEKKETDFLYQGRKKNAATHQSKSTAQRGKLHHVD